AFYPELQAIFDRLDLRVILQEKGARFSLLFGLERRRLRYRDLLAHYTALATRFYGFALEEGVYFNASWHHGFSAMHSRADVDEALERVERAATRLAGTRPAEGSRASASATRLP